MRWLPPVKSFLNAISSASRWLIIFGCIYRYIHFVLHFYISLLISTMFSSDWVTHMRIKFLCGVQWICLSYTMGVHWIRLHTNQYFLNFDHRQYTYFTRSFLNLLKFYCLLCIHCRRYEFCLQKILITAQVFLAELQGPSPFWY